MLTGGEYVVKSTYAREPAVVPFEALSRHHLISKFFVR
jgi:hypothetical protein